jgi:hypothetical protein
MVKSLVIPAIALASLPVLAVSTIAANYEANALLYNTAFNHGCTDAKIIDASQTYINQPKANATHHSAEFMNGGYHEGFKASAALHNRAELTRAQTDKSSAFDNMPISPPETHDNMSNLPSLKQQR